VTADGRDLSRPGVEPFPRGVEEERTARTWAAEITALTRRDSFRVDGVVAPVLSGRAREPSFFMMKFE
jgi:hypothetical protein